MKRTVSVIKEVKSKNKCELTLEKIKAAVDEGKTVCWVNDNYEVEKWADGYNIVCKHNMNAVGLTHRDGVTMNEKLKDFYIKE